MRIGRTFPIGAELVSGGVDFRVWAPRSRTAAVEFEAASGAPERITLAAEGGGYFSGHGAANPGMRYRIRLDQGAYPDPASRFQPEGPHGPSEIVHPKFPWTDSAWRGRPWNELVIYELHLGTFTGEG